MKNLKMKYLYCQVDEILRIEHTFIFSSSLYCFEKVKQQKNLI